MLDQPWPAMLRGIWAIPNGTGKPTGRGSPSRAVFAGDGARYDSDGNVWVLGRIDDVMNISGHRISTGEVESALVGHSGWPRPRRRGHRRHTGQAICAFVILKESAHGGPTT